MYLSRILPVDLQRRVVSHDADLPSLVHQLGYFSNSSIVFLPGFFSVPEVRVYALPNHIAVQDKNFLFFMDQLFNLRFHPLT